MTITPKTFVSLAIAAGLAICVIEGRVIYRQQTSLEAERRRTMALEQEIAGLRGHQTQAEHDLAAAEQQLAAFETEAAAASARLGIHASEIKSRLARLKELKNFFQQHPEHRIPELQLLSESDWLAAAQYVRLSSEDDTREAGARVREYAKETFAELLGAALRKYTAANDGRLPADVLQLQPYLESPVDPAMLQRYEMRHTGRVVDVPSGGKAIVERSPIDGEYDIRINISPTGSRGGTFPWASSELNDDTLEAERRYAAANQGRQPQDSADLLPYLQSPMARGWMEAWTAYLQAHGSREPSSPAELLSYTNVPEARAYIELLTAIERRKKR